MAAADDDRPTTDEPVGQREQAGVTRTGDPDLDGPADRTASSVKQNIDRVADKVKRLLRPED